MEKAIIEAIKPYIINDPVMVITLFVVVSYFKSTLNEVSGWIARVERESNEEIRELREQTRDGLKEERTYRHDVITEQDKRIHELTKEVSEIRARNRRP